MRHVVEAGTDAALLALFDPAALPADFDECVSGDLLERCRSLEREGRMRVIETGADGAYMLHAYEEEGVPEYLRSHLREPIVVEAFDVPSGRLYFAGAEYCFAKDDRRLRKHPYMGASLTLAPGTWHLTLCRTEYPADLQENLLRAQVGERAFRLHDSMGCLVGLALLAALYAVLSFFWFPARTWAWAALAPSLACASLPFLLTRTRTFRRVDGEYREIEREYPSVVAVLKRTSTRK